MTLRNGPSWRIYGTFPPALRQVFLERSKQYGQTHADYLAYLLEIEERAKAVGIAWITATEAP